MPDRAWLSSRSRGIPNTARIRSYASSGRPGKSAHELTIDADRQKARTRDCCFRRQPTHPCARHCLPACWLIQNRPDGLPLKSALTLFGRALRHAVVVQFDGAAMGASDGIYFCSVASLAIRVAAWLASSSNGSRVSEGTSSIGCSISCCLEMLNDWIATVCPPWEIASTLNTPRSRREITRFPGNGDELLIGHALQFPTGQSRLPRLWI
jgi:hypothetical protein